MKRIFALATCAILLLSACGGSNPTPAENAGTTGAGATATTGNDRGRIVFQERCAACHGLNGDAQSNNAANLPHSVLDSLAITQTIMNGRGTMPMFKDVLPDSDIASLAVYVKSLRK